MPAVPLGMGAYKRQSAFLPEVELVNLYLEEDKTGVSPDGTMRLGRPGLVTFGHVPEPGRVVYRADGVFNGDVFVLGHSGLYNVNEYTYINVGAVEAGGKAAIVGTKATLFTLSNGKIGRYDGTTLHPLPVPDGRYVADIATLDGYLLIACQDGRFFWLAPGATEIDALDFATAESAPDGLVAVESMGGEFYLFGRETVEPWQPTGDGDAPFQRAGGRLYQRGCASAASVVRFDNSIAWVGDDGVVYRADAVPMRLSEHGISTLR